MGDSLFVKNFNTSLMTFLLTVWPMPLTLLNTTWPTLCLRRVAALSRPYRNATTWSAVPWTSTIGTRLLVGTTHSDNVCRAGRYPLKEIMPASGLLAASPVYIDIVPPCEKPPMTTRLAGMLLSMNSDLMISHSSSPLAKTPRTSSESLDCNFFNVVISYQAGIFAPPLRVIGCFLAVGRTNLTWGIFSLNR